MISYNELERIMKKRIVEVVANFREIGINITPPINPRDIINLLIDLGGVDYLAYKNGFYMGLKKPTKAQSSINVLQAALLILYTDKKENEETTIKKVFNNFTKKNMVDIFPNSEPLQTPREPLQTPKEPAPEQEILDLSFIPTTAQKQVIYPINILYDPKPKKPKPPPKPKKPRPPPMNKPLPRKTPQPSMIKEIPKPEVTLQPIIEEETKEKEEDLTEGQKRALSRIVGPSYTRQDLGWLPNEEDEEDGGEWMDFEEADGEEVLDEIILKGSQYLLDEAKDLLDEEESQNQSDVEYGAEEEEDEENEAEVVENEEEEFTPDKEIQELLDETEEVLNRQFIPTAPPVIIQPDILDYGSIDGSSVPSPVVLSSPSVASELSEMDNLTPEDYAQMPVYTKKGNIVEPEYRKQDNENRGTKKARLWNRRRIRNKESGLGRFDIRAFDINEVYSEFLRGNIKETAKTEEELPNWLDEIMEADWTAVVPNYEVVSEDRPKTGEMLIDVIQRRVEEFSYQGDGEEALGMPTENYTKYQVLESNLDLEEFVGKNWKDKMRLNLRAIQRKKMRNQPIKKDLPLGERTIEYEDEY